MDCTDTKHLGKCLNAPALRLSRWQGDGRKMLLTCTDIQEMGQRVMTCLILIGQEACPMMSQDASGNLYAFNPWYRCRKTGIIPGSLS